MTQKKILTYKNARKAKKLIGKMVFASDYLEEITEFPNECDVGILQDFNDDCYCPFCVKGVVGSVQFIREL